MAYLGVALVLACGGYYGSQSFPAIRSAVLGAVHLLAVSQLLLLLCEGLLWATTTGPSAPDGRATFPYAEMLRAVITCLFYLNFFFAIPALTIQALHLLSYRRRAEMIWLMVSILTFVVVAADPTGELGRLVDF